MSYYQICFSYVCLCLLIMMFSLEPVAGGRQHAPAFNVYPLTCLSASLLACIDLYMPDMKFKLPASCRFTSQTMDASYTLQACPPCLHFQDFQKGNKPQDAYFAATSNYVSTGWARRIELDY